MKEKDWSLHDAQERCKEENSSYPSENYDPIRLDADGKAKMLKFYMDRRSEEMIEDKEYHAAYEEKEIIEKFGGTEHFLVKNRIDKKLYLASKKEKKRKKGNVAWIQEEEAKE